VLGTVGNDKVNQTVDTGLAMIRPKLIADVDFASIGF
jgi:hypothetical protein